MINRYLHEKNKIFKTTDLAISAYLCTSFQLLDVVKDPSGRAEFMFEKSPDLELAVNNYFNDTAKVSPNQYFHSLKNLKTRIYQEY